LGDVRRAAADEYGCQCGSHFLATRVSRCFPDLSVRSLRSFLHERVLIFDARGRALRHGATHGLHDKSTGYFSGLMSTETIGDCQQDTPLADMEASKVLLGEYAAARQICHDERIFIRAPF